MEDIKSLRINIDEIDSDIMNLFEKRMETVEKIADAKKAKNISLSDEDREKAVIENAVLKSAKFKGETELFVNSLIAVSKMRQRKLIYAENEFSFSKSCQILKDISDIKVAYQGVPGAWAQIACNKMFLGADIYNIESGFEAVFKEVKEGNADFGVIPIENSHTGAIGEVYDLLGKYGCYITRQEWIDINHCVMVNEGVKLNDIREVLSHPEVFKQCSKYLDSKAWDLTACKNTAIAAQTVLEKKDKRIAAIGSLSAAKIYGLEVVKTDIINDPTNKTRFIAISKEPIYDKSCKTVSLKIITAHKSGALMNALFPFMANGVNLSRIESRPIYGGKYGFFIDLEGNIEDVNIKSAIQMCMNECSYLEILGCF